MIRFTLTRDHPQLKTLWAEAFGDSRAVIDAYFTHRHADTNMLVDVREGRVAGMLSMLPVTLDIHGGQPQKARYIYAVATTEQFRRQGVSTALLESAHEHMQGLGEAAAILVPADRGLFSYYKKRGYQTDFSLNILTVRAQELLPFPRQGRSGACSAGEYARLRNLAFADSSLYVRWEESAVSYAVRTFAQPGGVTAISWEGGHGCAAWEKTMGDVLVRELALPDGDWQTALAVLHGALKARRYTVRLAAGTVPGAVLRPFGMIRWVVPKPQLSGKPPYLSLAMD